MFFKDFSPFFCFFWCDVKYFCDVGNSEGLVFLDEAEEFVKVCFVFCACGFYFSFHGEDALASDKFEFLFEAFNFDYLETECDARKEKSDDENGKVMKDAGEDKEDNGEEGPHVGVKENACGWKLKFCFGSSMRDWFVFDGKNGTFVEREEEKCYEHTDNADAEEEEIIL